MSGQPQIATPYDDVTKAIDTYRQAYLIAKGFADAAREADERATRVRELSIAAWDKLHDAKEALMKAIAE